MCEEPVQGLGLGFRFRSFDLDKNVKISCSVTAGNLRV